MNRRDERLRVHSRDATGLDPVGPRDERDRVDLIAVLSSRVFCGFVAPGERKENEEDGALHFPSLRRAGRAASTKVRGLLVDARILAISARCF